MYQGFMGLTSDFLEWHGTNHYIVPVRINGSAIESLFSRFKYDADGNLSAVNYETAMARLLTAKAVDTMNKDSEYRNADINVKCTLKERRKSNYVCMCVLSSNFLTLGCIWL